MNNAQTGTGAKLSAVDLYNLTAATKDATTSTGEKVDLLLELQRKANAKKVSANALVEKVDDLDTQVCDANKKLDSILERQSKADAGKVSAAKMMETVSNTEAVAGEINGKLDVLPEIKSSVEIAEANSDELLSISQRITQCLEDLADKVDAIPKPRKSLANNVILLILAIMGIGLTASIFIPQVTVLLSQTIWHAIYVGFAMVVVVLSALLNSNKAVKVFTVLSVLAPIVALFILSIL